MDRWVRKEEYDKLLSQAAETQHYYNEICYALGYPGDTEVAILVNHIIELRSESRNNIGVK